MKNKLRIKHRLILPVILLGVVALISNILSVFSIHNVNANASDIVDNYMTGAAKLEEIRRSITNTHKMALKKISRVLGSTSQERRKRSFSSSLIIMIPSGTHWSFSSVPVRTAKPRMPTTMQMEMWHPLPQPLRIISMIWIPILRNRPRRPETAFPRSMYPL